MKTIRSQEIDPSGIAHEVWTFTGDGGGMIAFQKGNPRPIVTPAPVADGPTGARWKSHWEKHHQELSVRDEGARGLPIDHRHPHHQKLGIVDVKEAVALRMLEALHSGDADYFKGLAKSLAQYDEPGGHEKQHCGPDSRDKVVEAIRRAAGRAETVPSVDQVFGEMHFPASTKKDKFVDNYLKPTGFNWLPRKRAGRPGNSPK